MKPPPLLTAPAAAAPLAWVLRGHLVESVHAGHLVALDGSGDVALARGEPAQEIYPRSAVKPLQALAMLRAGVQLDDEQLALACSSHSGTPRHVAVVRSVLAAAGMSEDDLQNTPGLPLHGGSAAEWTAAGHAESSLAQNCSGKHAAMLAACVAAGWPTAGYLRVGHPLQVLIGDVLAEVTGVPAGHVTVDGCGAPLFSTTVVGLARAFARLTTARPGTDEARVAGAMSAHPWLVGGPDREVTAAMVSVPGLVAKDGAEGVFAGALPDGRAFAFKVSDGAKRPVAVVAAAALHVLGVEGSWPWEHADVLGHGAPAGSVQPAFGARVPAGLR